MISKTTLSKNMPLARNISIYGTIVLVLSAIVFIHHGNMNMKCKSRLYVVFIIHTVGVTKEFAIFDDYGNIQILHNI